MRGMRRSLPAIFFLTLLGCEQDLTPEILANAEYLSQHVPGGYVRLTNGKFESYDDRITVGLAGKHAFGDLNGDGVDEAAVVLATNTGGSGVFFDLAVVGNTGGEALNIASRFIGDRIDVHSVTIVDGEIIVRITTHAPDDPMCCPTQNVTQRYRLMANAIVQQ